MKKFLLSILGLTLCQILVGQTSQHELILPSATTIYRPIFIDTNLIPEDTNLVWHCADGLIRHYGDQKEYLDLKTFTTCQYSRETYQKTVSGYNLIDRQAEVELIKTSDSTLTFNKFGPKGVIILSKTLHFDLTTMIYTDSAYYESPRTRMMELTITNAVEVK